MIVYNRIVSCALCRIMTDAALKKRAKTARRGAKNAVRRERDTSLSDGRQKP